MKNEFVSSVFRNIAELLEINEDNPFRIRAYIRAADNLDALKIDIEDMIAEKKLEDVPGIGHDLASKIKEIVKTGTCQQYEDLKKIIPEGVVALLQVPSVGPQSARLFFDKLKIASIDELKTAATKGKLSGLPGIKDKSVANILKGITLLEKGLRDMDVLTATTVAEGFVEKLRALAKKEKIVPAGSLRRMKDGIHDVDILIASNHPQEIIASFLAGPGVKKILAQGPAKSSILTDSDQQVDLRVFKPQSFGAGLIYFTGSKNHNIRLRQLAIKKDYKINEYGVFDKKNKCMASKTEEEVYKALGLDFIPPELREDTGEIEAALNHELPELISLGDIKGDFHVHTNYSDGENSIEEMARRAHELGYQYICLTDHSASLKIARGLSPADLKKKKKEIEKVQKRLKKIRILFGTEVEIDAQGSLDYKDSVLKEFDLVVAAIHSGFKQSKEQLTRRIVRACENKYVHIIAHPTGKLRVTRDSYEIDFKEILKVARQTNTALEINAHPYRMDLSDIYARAAKDNGVRCAIDTDAHNTGHLEYMKFGVGLARRGWLEKQNVLNSLSLPELLKTIKK
jgi:DNA polymerase (family 10)